MSPFERELETRLGVRNLHPSWLRRHHNDNIEYAVGTILRGDLREISRGSFDWDISRSHRTELTKKTLVQVEDVINAGTDNPRSDSGLMRTLLLTITDGRQEVCAIEWVNFGRVLGVNIVPGVKMCLDKGSVVARGRVLLEPRFVKLLGGTPRNIWGEHYEKKVSEALELANFKDPNRSTFDSLVPRDQRGGGNGGKNGGNGGGGLTGLGGIADIEEENEDEEFWAEVIAAEAQTQINGQNDRGGSAAGIADAPVNAGDNRENHFAGDQQNGHSTRQTDNQLIANRDVTNAPATGRNNRGPRVDIQEVIEKEDFEESRPPLALQGPRVRASNFNEQDYNILENDAPAEDVDVIPDSRMYIDDRDDIVPETMVPETEIPETEVPGTEFPETQSVQSQTQEDPIPVPEPDHEDNHEYQDTIIPDTDIEDTPPPSPRTHAQAMNEPVDLTLDGVEEGEEPVAIPEPPILPDTEGQTERSDPLADIEDSTNKMKGLDDEPQQNMEDVVHLEVSESSADDDLIVRSVIRNKLPLMRLRDVDSRITQGEVAYYRCYSKKGVLSRLVNDELILFIELDDGTAVQRLDVSRPLRKALSPNVSTYTQVRNYSDAVINDWKGKLKRDGRNVFFITVRYVRGDPVVAKMEDLPPIVDDCDENETKRIEGFVGTFADNVEGRLNSFLSRRGPSS
eukprot:Plantae.Rhodophyta-Hildenbrandia_rubra.ctg9340.p1 GENE.Plantae.Rhodophyta-Hildenbrandia_rubra.ctg9340~~Plantae.Rhodophyta-Hildenbrandia_rubra.ctg9340.p1  ORF type:complete len:682 (+),score=137.00 Plantae.Rhodophyta-Hildenbrandia_rubra.ctg9340:610-2655(+)